MHPQTRAALTEYLGQFITPHKRKQIAQKLEHRTRHLTVAIENVYQSQNASAVVRTAEILGLQDLYFIEDENKYKVNKAVVRGAAYWLDLHRFNEEGQSNTTACIKTLRARGYKIVATTPHKDGITPWEIPLDHKLAFLLGTEKYGLSEHAIGAADHFIQLPMYGFTHSYNLSVTGAIILSHTVERLRRSEINWQLSEEEKATLTLQWYRRIIDKSEHYEKQFLAGQP